MDTTTVFGTVDPRSSRGEGIKAMRKILFIAVLATLFFPLVSLAQVRYSVSDSYCGDPASNYTVSFEGIVPCGRCLEVDPAAPAPAWWDNECGQPVSACGNTLVKFVPCTICHVFVMLDGIARFILVKIVPPIATLIFIFGGVSYYQAGENPEKTRFAKKVITTAVIGMVLIYGAWLFINTILTMVGVAQWTGLIDDPATPQDEGNWFEITCEIKYKPQI